MKPEVNYFVEALKSRYNVIFVGVMVCLMILAHFGFFWFLIAGEVIALILSQNKSVQRIIDLKHREKTQNEMRESEESIVRGLSGDYQMGFASVTALCTQIQERVSQLQGSDTSGINEKLTNFRHEYAKRLRFLYLMRERANAKDETDAIQRNLTQIERSLQTEASPQVRRALEQNKNILKKRLARVSKIKDLTRLITEQLRLVENSLELMLDEVYTSGVSQISDLVDGLMMEIDIADEFKADYEDIAVELAAQSAAPKAAAPVNRLRPRQGQTLR